jgi:branched-chain amino acid transport system ATP-binding protein
MDSPSSTHALVVNNVSKNFGGVQAVHQVSLVVSNGERRALIGPNGAGKTTLFNVITGELIADEGRIKIFDEEITRKSVQQRSRLGLGRTYQISQLFLKLSVEENLFLASAANRDKEFKLWGPWHKHRTELDRAEEVARQVGLSLYMNARVSELSHGLQRQLELGMAIARQPRLIMLDEPAAGLSPTERVILTSLIKELPRTVTLILIEHDMEIVLDLADSITVLHRGSVIAEGSPEEIKANQDVQNVYLGSSYA